jgi:hypothetical protein
MSGYERAKAFYVKALAFMLDPDGHNIETVRHTPA